MLFNSPIFLFCFLPLFLILHFLAGKSLRNIVIILSSLFFYAWGEPTFIGIVLISALFDWLAGNAIFHENRRAIRQLYLSVGILANVGLLLYFKYANFFVESFNNLLASVHFNPLPLTHIALPIGVSFIVFEKITYIVDIYRHVGEPATSIRSYLLYVLLFPKLLAGPIIKYHDIVDQLTQRNPSIEDVGYGLKRFVIGLGKKVLIADTLSPIVEAAFKLPTEELGFYNAWLGVICFTLQIYFDFSGYSDMAIGLARIMGFRLLENFNSPYISESFTEFWRRWHISLSTWIRDYLYIPLGGSRISPYRTYFNLWLCFLICGIWHGANWSFVVWGIYHGTFLIIEKLCWLKYQKYVPRPLNVLMTFFFVMIGWSIFRLETVAQIGYFVPALFGFSTSTAAPLYISANIQACIIIGLLISFSPSLNVEKATLFYRNMAWRRECEMAMTLAVFILSISQLAITNFSPFLYFRF
jgi:alginate O-acetyltransferase complex protein AlgI